MTNLISIQPAFSSCYAADILRPETHVIRRSPMPGVTASERMRERLRSPPKVIAQRPKRPKTAMNAHQRFVCRLPSINGVRWAAMHPWRLKGSI
ncbi:hypothetical protein TNCV_2679711 [Trichonephila clavipes]|nr:hypothetical protein TNCV_2679711 [Trichonephila clavipes]